jgi:hypothetical protein
VGAAGERAQPGDSSGGGWVVATYRPKGDALPTGTRYLKFTIKPTGTSWNIQLGRLEIHRRAPAAAAVR